MNGHDKPTVEAVVTFLSRDEGGRQSPAFASTQYRPHLVIGDPGQRDTPIDENGYPREDYLGVAFEGSGKPMEAGVPQKIRLVLMYHPHVDYSALEAGTTFTIREGHRVVAFGQISEQPTSWHGDATDRASPDR